MIRAAVARDYDAYLRLVEQVDRLHAESAGRYYRVPPAPARARDYFLSRLTEPYAILVAEQEGRVIAYAHLEARDEPSVPVLVPMHWANVSDLVVDQAARRQGAGRALMAEARRWAKSRGCVDLRLSVSAFNKEAMAFYASEGFVVKHTVLGQALDRP